MPMLSMQWQWLCPCLLHIGPTTPDVKGRKDELLQEAKAKDPALVKDKEKLTEMEYRCSFQ